MDQLTRESVLVGLARRLFEKGSWSGEIHIQAAVYLLQELTHVPLGYEFALRKQAPFSFELRDELVSMRTDQLVQSQPQPPPYPPRIIVGQRGRELEERFRQTIEGYGPKLDWIGQHVGSKIELELERLATALWITRQNEQANVEWRTKELMQIRQHVHRYAALMAVQEIDDLLGQAKATRP